MSTIDKIVHAYRWFVMLFPGYPVKELVRRISRYTGYSQKRVWRIIQRYAIM